MKNTNRRKFIRNLGGSVTAFGLSNVVRSQESSTRRTLNSMVRTTANDMINIGLIGSGIIGHFDTDAALKVDGVRLTAVCDLYYGRLDRAKEKYGADIVTTKDYRELLNRKDIDAILICTPDHWHQRIAIDAMNADKHVYCEKPMVQKIEEGWALINTQKKTKKVFQVGSQRASSAAIHEVKKLFDQGTIGELTFIEAYCDRTDARGAWQYSIPTDASPSTIDWDRFLGHAPKVSFDPVRFFRWRNYKDYGTGAAGDLIVHLLTGIHTITGSFGPEKIYSVAELNYWKDGRDAFDVVNAIMSYPKTSKLPSYQVMTRVNLCEGSGAGGFGIKMIGTDGVIDIGWNDFKVKTVKRKSSPGYGGYDSFDSFSEKQKEDFKKWYTDKYGLDTDGGYDLIAPTEYNAPKGYDDRLDHMITFFNAIRTGSPILEDASFGLRAAAPSLSCNLSAQQKKEIKWDPISMKLVN